METSARMQYGVQIETTDLDVSIGPRGVWAADELGHSGDEDEESNGKDGLLIDDLFESVSVSGPPNFHALSCPTTPCPYPNMTSPTHVDLGGDSGGSEGSTEDDTAGFGQKRGRWDRVDDSSGLLVGCLCKNDDTVRSNPYLSSPTSPFLLHSRVA